MPLNVVLNNSSHAFSVSDDQLRADFDQPKVTGSDGSDAQVAASLRAQLEDGSLAASGRGLIANFQA